MMRKIRIDCAGVKSEAEVWQRYLDAAANPEGSQHFGRNLNAFWDAIQRGGPGWPGEADLTFTNTAELASLKLADGASFLEELRKIANDSTNTRIELI